jgi:prophage antirepressor-like protein
VPYIQQARREELLKHPQPETAGELNYIVTEIVLQYLDKRGEQYQTYAEIEGALQHVLRELYRRKVADYETRKMRENGDVFESPSSRERRRALL